MDPLRYLIGGEWRSSNRIRPVINSFAGQTVSEVYQTPAAEISEACERAAKGFRSTRKLPSYERRAILSRIAGKLRRRKEELAQSITTETAKPVSLARAEVDRAIFTFDVSAEEAGRIGGEILPLDLAPGSDGRTGLIRRFPLGVIGAITPFNFPLNLVAHKVGPAIASGNAIVLKPSSNAPGVALMLGDTILECGFPEEAIHIVVCAGGEAGQLITNKAVNMLSFTGSPSVGWGLKAAAPTRRVALELGGNAGVIVDEGADIPNAAKKLAIGGFANAGQSCISVQRVFVPTRERSAFLEAFLTEVKKLQVGDPFDERTLVSAMIDEAAARKVEEWVEEAVKAGALVLLGGKRSGSLFQPTIVTNVPRTAKIACQEVFAPLVVVETFDEFDDAIARVNESEFGLQAGLFSNNAAHIFQAYRELEVGGVVVNDASAYRMDHMPYGGVKGSGAGREGVRYAIEEMTEMKLLALSV